jgi:hypothetical protein
MAGGALAGAMNLGFTFEQYTGISIDGEPVTREGLGCGCLLVVLGLVGGAVLSGSLFGLPAP